jgi:hypothetical protein
MKNRLLLFCALALFSCSNVFAASALESEFLAAKTVGDVDRAARAADTALERGRLSREDRGIYDRILSQAPAKRVALEKAAADAAKAAEVAAAEAKAKKEAEDAAADAARKAAEDAESAAMSHLASEAAKYARLLTDAGDPQLANQSEIKKESTNNQLYDLACRQITDSGKKYSSTESVDAAIDRLVQEFMAKRLALGGGGRTDALVRGDLESTIDGTVADLKSTVLAGDQDIGFDFSNLETSDVYSVFEVWAKKNKSAARNLLTADTRKALAKAATVFRVEKAIAKGTMPSELDIQAIYKKMIANIEMLCKAGADKFKTIGAETKKAELRRIAAAKAEKSLKTKEARQAMLLKRAQAERDKKRALVAKEAALAAQAVAEAAQKAAEAKEEAAELAKSAADAAKAKADSDLADVNAQLAAKTAEAAAEKAAKDAAVAEAASEKAEAAAAKAAQEAAVAARAAADAEAAAAKADLAEAQRELATAKSEKDDADKDLAAARAQLKILTEGGGDAVKLAEAVAKQRKAEEAAAEAARKLAAEQAQLAAAQAELATARDAERVAKTAVEAAEKAAKDAAAHAAGKLKKATGTLQGDINKLQEKRKGYKKQARDANASKAAVEADLARVQRELAVAEHTIAANNTEIARLKAGSDAAELQAAKDALAAAERARDEAVTARQAKEIELVAERNAVASAKQAEAEAVAEVGRLTALLSAESAAKETAQTSLATVAGEKDTALAEVADAKTKGKTELADQLWTAAYGADTAFPDGKTPKPAVDAMGRTLGEMLKAARDVSETDIGVKKANGSLIGDKGLRNKLRAVANTYRTALCLPLFTAE